MKKKLWIRLAQAMACAVVTAILLFWGMQIRMNQIMDLRTAYTAARDILPREKITEQDLVQVQIPAAYLQDSACTEKEEIIGKYTEIQGMIPKGSPFYRSMLKTENEMPDSPLSMLKKGQASYSLQIDLTSGGGNLIASGQRVDLYVSIERKDQTPVTDCLFQNVRVISIRDHKGLDLQNEKSTGIPYLAVLAVDRGNLNLLSTAEQVGKVRLTASASSYDVKAEAVLNKESAVLPYLQEEIRLDEVIQPESETWTEDTY